jgi:hypothetical protein
MSKTFFFIVSLKSPFGRPQTTGDKNKQAQEPHNVMYSNKTSNGGHALNDKTSTTVTSEQIEAIYKKYVGGRINLD